MPASVCGPVSQRLALLVRAVRRCNARASSNRTNQWRERAPMTMPALSFAVPAHLFQAAGIRLNQPAEPDSQPIVRPGCIYVVKGKPVRFKVNIDASVVSLEHVDLDGMGPPERLW